MARPDPAAEAIEAALDRLRESVRRAVRAEQLVDRLTRLANDEALTEWIQALIDEGAGFWLAFVEVDRFKNVNDEFGYELADELLRRVGDQLGNASENFFASAATPFRAHGDEFFLGGPGNEDGVGDALRQVRGAIAQVRVADLTSGKRTMRCTVSIGWATSADAQLGGRILTERALRAMLEAAVAEAKRTRDCVVRYTPALRKPSTREGRFDCGGCGAKTTLRVPVEDERSSELRCPNCGEALERPVSLRPASSS